MKAAASLVEAQVQPGEGYWRLMRARWYNTERPHQGLGQRTQDVFGLRAVGLPDVDDRLPFAEYTYLVRREFDQYVNYRPVKLLEGMTSEDGMTRVRKAYLAEEEKMDANARMQLLAAANHCERLIWLFGDMGKAYTALGSN